MTCELGVGAKGGSVFDGEGVVRFAVGREDGRGQERAVGG